MTDQVHTAVSTVFDFLDNIIGFLWIGVNGAAGGADAARVEVYFAKDNRACRVVLAAKI